MPKKEKVLLFAILLAYLVLTANYAVAPLFEAPDEALHYEYVQYIAEEQDLPDPYSRTWSQFPQAPLYYILLSPILMVMPDAHFAQKYGPNVGSPYPDPEGVEPAYKLWANPYLVTKPSRNLVQQNRNGLLHSRDEAFPYNQDSTARNTFILRLASIFMSLLTLWFCYQTFILLWPENLYRRSLALSIVAFLPLFQRISASVNNDNLSILLVTISLYLILLQQSRGWTLKRSICLGVVLGLALATKTYASALAIPVGIAMVLERRSWRYAPLILGLTVLLGGWWYLYNLITYDAILANDHPQVVNTSVNGDNTFSLEHALATFPDIFTNMFARFDTLLVNIWLDRIFQVGLGLAIIGTIIMMFRFTGLLRTTGWTEERWLVVKQSLVIASFVIIWFLTIFYASGVQLYGTQGRYALNAIAGLAAIMALGWTAWLPPRLERPFSLSVATGLFAMALIVYVGYFRAVLQPLSVSDQIEHVLNLRYEEAAQLLGTNDATLEGQPGDTVEVVLNWEAIAPATSQQVVVYVTAVGNEIISKHSYPAGGNLLATDWEAGEQWREHYFVKLPTDTETQRVYPLTAGLYDVSTDHTFVAYDSQGNPIFPTIGQLIVHGQPTDNRLYDYQFGDVIGLQEPILEQAGDATALCLTWVSLKRVPTDYHFFIHIYADGEVVDQIDGQPRQGNYPTTAWLPGEEIKDCLMLDASALDESSEHIQLGLYELESFVRLPITRQDDKSSMGDSLTIELD